MDSDHVVALLCGDLAELSYAVVADSEAFLIAFAGRLALD
jgi:hypothetical protein